MPMKYNEDTGVPYFVPDTAIELDEGVTPKPDVLRYGKRGIFAGDPPPKFDNGLNTLSQKPIDSTSRLVRGAPGQGHRDSPLLGALDPKPKAKGAIPEYPGKPAPPSDSEFFAKLTKALVPPDDSPAGPPDSPVQKAYDDAFDFDKLAEGAKPAPLSAKIATDEEIAEIERLAHEHSVMHWPTLMRLINRLRMTEELLAAARREG